MEVKVLKDSYYGKHRKVTLQVEARPVELLSISSLLRLELCNCTDMLNRDAIVVTDSHWHLETLASTFHSTSNLLSLFLDEVRRVLHKSVTVERAIHAPFVSDSKIKEVFKSENFEEELRNVVGLSVYQCWFGTSYEPEEVVLGKLKNLRNPAMVVAFNHCGIVYNEVDGYVSPHVFMSKLTNYGV
jgi:hypothetical protein